MGFAGRYYLEEIGYRTWRYFPHGCDPLRFTTKCGVLTVMDREFETDGATTPRFLWSIPGFDPLDWPKAAVLHDWLFELKHMGESTIGFHAANRMLAEALVSLGWSAAHAWSIRRAIDLFGGGYWNRPEMDWSTNK